MRAVSPIRCGQGHRPAFTLIEVIVVIVVIGLLLAILIPAVQGARESARRANCSNNLRQIGIAIHGYAAANGVLPEGGNFESEYSFLTMLLPYVDQRPLYNAINFDTHPISGPGSPNFTARETRIGVFLCPSDSIPPGFGGMTNYAGNMGYGAQAYGQNGAFLVGDHPPLGLGDFRDGTSSTVVVSEWVLGPGNVHARDIRRSIFSIPSDASGPDGFDSFCNRCRAVAPDDVGPADIYNAKGSDWMVGGSLGSLYHHSLNINDPSCFKSHDSLNGAISAGSQHPYGALSLLLDGHVAFINDTINIKIWRSMGTRNGGELIAGGSPLE